LADASARVVVIGGGIAGCSVAYHLAAAGWRDVVLLEKGELTSGSTHHAAGLVTQFNPSATMMRFRRYSVSLYNQPGVFNTVGSVRIASSQDSLRDLKRAVSRARALGLDAELLEPAGVLDRMPFASPESLRRTAPCHNDLMPGNFIESDGPGSHLLDR
jgi:glycine/D-amino acid oxidase-like deaminating enzyme